MYLHPMSDEDLIREVTEVLSAVGGKRTVPFEVTRVEADGARIHADVVLHYFRDTPVCCGTPGCYVPFLGQKRRDVPGALACKLSLRVAPRVSMTIHMRHEQGYCHINLATGEAAGPGIDSTEEYPEQHFEGDEARHKAVARTEV